MEARPLARITAGSEQAVIDGSQTKCPSKHANYVLRQFRRQESTNRHKRLFVFSPNKTQVSYCFSGVEIVGPCRHQLAALLQRVGTTISILDSIADFVR